MEAGNLRLQKFNAEASLRHLSDQVAHALEEMSRLMSELGTVRAEEETFWFSTELIALRFEAEALCACGTNPDISRETSHAKLEVVRGEVSVLQERVTILGSREAELLAESVAAWAKVAQL
ncbi:hypothetical protein ACLOJK_019418 [Asimina triloba]